MIVLSGETKFLNPFILASGPPTRTGDMIARAFKLGWAGAVTKTISLNYKQMIDVSPRIAEINGGFQNIELVSPRPPEDWADDIKRLKAEYSDNTVIASITAEADKFADWHKLTLMMQQAGADVLELNFSCPHGLPEMGMGATCSDSPQIAADIVEEIKKVSMIPVWAKLSPNVPNISLLADICAKSGADGITAINTVKGFAGIDIETGMPKINVAGSSAYGGISGGLIKPVAMKAVSEIASSVNIAVSAAGGIRNWRDAVEFIMLGASTVQICTEVMLNGYEIITELNNGLYEYFKRHNINSMEEIKGKSLKYIKSHSELDNDRVSYAVIDENKCVNCGKCYKACEDSGYQAIIQNYAAMPVIAKEKCTGCGLCKIVCPLNCIELTLNKVTISELQR